MKCDLSILNEMRLKYIEWNETQVYWMKWDLRILNEMRLKYIEWNET